MRHSSLRGKMAVRWSAAPLTLTMTALAITILVTTSGPAFADTADTQPPTAPTDLRVVNNWGDCAFEFSWSGSADDISANIAYAFVVDGGIDPTYSWWWNATNHAWGDCMNYPLSNGTYTIQVVARDDAGNVSAASNSVSVTVRFWA
jgi:hypothetical protein